MLGRNSGLQAEAGKEARIECRMSPSLASPLAALVLGDLARAPAQLEGNQNLGINLGRPALSCGTQPGLQRRAGGENQHPIAPQQHSALHSPTELSCGETWG